MTTATITTNRSNILRSIGLFVIAMMRAIIKYFSDYMNSRQAKFHAAVFSHSFLCFVFTVLTLIKFHLI